MNPELSDRPTDYHCWRIPLSFVKRENIFSLKECFFSILFCRDNGNIGETNRLVKVEYHKAEIRR